jgi:hypothetical protein
LGWSRTNDGIVVQRVNRGAGRTVLAIDCDDAALAARIDSCLGDLPIGDRADATVIVRAEPAGHRLALEMSDGSIEDLGTARTDDQALRLVAWVVSRQARRSVQHLAVLHGSVLAGEWGAMVLCGGTQTGKSTLTIAGVVAGLEYLSDDMAVVDIDALTVEPFARPIMLRAGGRQILSGRIELPGPLAPSGDSGDETFVAAGQFGRVADMPRPVVALGVIGRGDEPTIEPLTQAEMLQALVGHCVTLDTGGAALFAELARLAAACPGWSVTVDPEVRVVDLLTDLVGGVRVGGVRRVE